jgi:hypothetical protein
VIFPGGNETGLTPRGSSRVDRLLFFRDSGVVVDVAVRPEGLCRPALGADVGSGRVGQVLHQMTDTINGVRGAALRTEARWVAISRKIGREAVPKENRISTGAVASSSSTDDRRRKGNLRDGRAPDAAGRGSHADLADPLERGLFHVAGLDASGSAFSSDVWGLTPTPLVGLGSWRFEFTDRGGNVLATGTVVAN